MATKNFTASTPPDGPGEATPEDSPNSRFNVAEHLDKLAYDMEGIASTLFVIGETLSDVDKNMQNGLFLLGRNAARLNEELCEISMRVRTGKAPRTTQQTTRGEHHG